MICWPAISREVRANSRDKLKSGGNLLVCIDREVNEVGGTLAKELI